MGKAALHRHHGKLQPVLPVSVLLCDMDLSQSQPLPPSKLSQLHSARQHSAAVILGLPIMSNGAKEGMEL